MRSLVLIVYILSEKASLTAQPGLLDSSFGHEGLVQIQYTSTGFNAGYDVALQPDGKIVVCGAVEEALRRMAVFRFLSTGEPDPAFGSNGVAMLPQLVTGSFGYRLVVQPDGKIVVAGQINTDGSAPWDVVIARFLSDGSPDPAFGDIGVVFLDMNGEHDQVLGLALEKDGDILVTGLTAGLIPGTGAWMARFRPNGDLDAAFADQGIWKSSFTDFAHQLTCVTVLVDGKILAGGTFSSPTGKDDYLLMRFLPDGSPDPAFGDNGLRHYDFGYSIVVQPDHKIIVAGYSWGSAGYSVAMARYLSNFDPDPYTTTLLDNTLRVYPCPTSGPLTLEYGLSRQSPVGLDLYDVQGRLIQTLQTPEIRAADFHREPLVLDERVPAGAYFLAVSRDGRRKYLPVVKQ